MLFYYYVDYERARRLPDGLGYFHAQWRRENPTDGIERRGVENEEYQFGGDNTRRATATTRSSRRGAGATTWAATWTSTTCARDPEAGTGTARATT